MHHVHMLRSSVTYGWPSWRIWKHHEDACCILLNYMLLKYALSIIVPEIISRSSRHRTSFLALSGRREMRFIYFRWPGDQWDQWDQAGGRWKMMKKRPDACPPVPYDTCDTSRQPHSDVRVVNPSGAGRSVAESPCRLRGSWVFSGPWRWLEGSIKNLWQC